MLEKSRWAIQEIDMALGTGADEYCSGEGLIALRMVKDFLGSFRNNNDSAREAHTQLKTIVDKIANGIPLTPITDAPEEWKHFDDGDEEDGRTFRCYQSIRYPALFQYKYEDGEVVYSDVDRLVVRDVNRFGIPGSSYVDGEITDVLDRIEPITMPYMPEKDKYVVYMASMYNDGELRSKMIDKIEKGEVKINGVYSIHGFTFASPEWE